MENNIFKNNKIYYMLIAIIVAIFMVTLLDFFPKKGDKSPPNADLVNSKADAQSLSKEDILEKKLQKILTKIEGVNSADVMVTLESSEQIEPAFNQVKSTEVSDEKDSSGGRRVVTTENSTQTIVTQNNKDKSEPILLKSIEPQVKGVIIVADGAEDVVVKERIFDAVKTVLQISGNKIDVYPKK